MNAALKFQSERIRAMSAEEKVSIAHALWVEAWVVTASGVQARNPSWTAEQVAVQVRELMSGAGV